MRPSSARQDQLRRVSLEPGVAKHAEGSCLVKFGDTHVLVTASLEEKAPPFLKGTGKGWVTAEYGMLPRSTHERMRREAAQGKQSGRTQEIQRLVGRCLRAMCRSDGAWRAPDRDRLRRDPGRWRHAHRVDHRRLRGAAPMRRLHEERRHGHQARDQGSCRGDLLRHHAKASRCSISITTKIPAPRPMRISCSPAVAAWWKFRAPPKARRSATTSSRNFCGSRAKA